ncbi:peptidase M14, partial [Asanoa sp. NPDC050611]
MSTRRIWVAGATAAVLTVGLLAPSGSGVAAPPTTAAPAAGPAVKLAAGETALVRFRLPNEAMLRDLVASGADVAARPRTTLGQVQVDLVVSDQELAALTARGAVATQLIQTATEGSARAAASKRAAAGDTARALVANTDTLQFLQSYWWTTEGQSFLAVQVATTATDDPDVEITVTWTTADGRTGSFPLSRFEDSGEYQYHVALPQPVPAQPVTVKATSSLGGATRAITPSAWPGATPPPLPAGYQKDFISAYMTPTDIQARIKRLKRQYPALVDVIDLPNKTQGYRRTATAYLGDTANAAIVVESVKFGDQKMNGVQAKTVDPGKKNRPLNATYKDRVLTVSLAT